MAQTTASSAATQSAGGGSRARRLVAIGAIVLVAGVALFFVRGFLGDFLGNGIPQFSAWIDGLGFWGPAAYALLYAVGAVLALPGSVLTLLGGALFGLWKGTLTVFAGAALGSSLAFLISRYLAREWVAGRVARNASLARIDRAVGQQGFRIVFLMRLSPVFPFSAMNYMLGLTRVRFADYVLASIGMIPGTLLYVYYGTLIGSAAQVAAGAPQAGGLGQWLMRGLGLVATIAVVVAAARLAKRALDSELPLEEGGQS